MAMMIHDARTPEESLLNLPPLVPCRPTCRIRQCACSRPECQAARRKKTQASWRAKSPEYGAGCAPAYPRLGILWVALSAPARGENARARVREVMTGSADSSWEFNAPTLSIPKSAPAAGSQRCIKMHLTIQAAHLAQSACEKCGGKPAFVFL